MYVNNTEDFETCDRTKLMFVVVIKYFNYMEVHSAIAWIIKLP